MPTPPSEDDRDPGRVYRPYMVTRGKTRPAQASTDPDLELEALIATTQAGELAVTLPNEEWRTIALLCRDVLSLAEVAARLDVPIGVARVLVGDMTAVGLTIVHRPRYTQAGDRPDLALLERVLHGLRDI